MCAPAAQAAPSASAGPYVTSPQWHRQLVCIPHEQATMRTNVRSGRRGCPRGQRVGALLINLLIAGMRTCCALFAPLAGKPSVMISPAGNNEYCTPLFARDHGRPGRPLRRSRAALWRHGGQVHRRRTDGGLRGTRGAGRPRCSPFEVALGFTPWIGPCDGPKRKSIAAQLALQSQM